MDVRFNVLGTPAGQGSKAFKGIHGGKAIMVESSKKLQPWRDAVLAAALQAMNGIPSEPLFRGAVAVHATFYFARPKAHFRTGRNCHLLRDGAPRFYQSTKPDIDKVLRATFDALTSAGVWVDDARVAEEISRKLYADTRPPGAEIIVEAVGEAGMPEGQTVVRRFGGGA